MLKEALVKTDSGGSASTAIGLIIISGRGRGDHRGLIDGLCASSSSTSQFSLSSRYASAQEPCHVSLDDLKHHRNTCPIPSRPMTLQHSPHRPAPRSAVSRSSAAKDVYLHLMRSPLFRSRCAIYRALRSKSWARREAFLFGVLLFCLVECVRWRNFGV